VKLLLHVCCGPCATGTLEWLRGEFPASETTGLFYNPNIHPETEYSRRRQAMELAADALELPLICSGEEEGLVAYLHQVAFREADRCRNCYAMRLAHAAQRAAAGNFDAFSTTLLISPYQNLEALRTIGEALAKLHGPDFIFHDLRPYFPLSRRRAKELALYQQKYCGCIFSELERIHAKAKRKGLIMEGADSMTPFSNMAAANARPFTLPGLDPEATQKLLSSLTGGPSPAQKEWRPWGSG
jgi:predicted adenine nucleotide alpha hydrolase (AANH) superfamily ATPase